MSLEQSPARKRKPHTPKSFTLQDRLVAGAFTIAEFCKLAGVSRATFNRHRDSGLIRTIKRGGKVFVPGPEGRRYLGLDAAQ